MDIKHEGDGESGLLKGCDTQINTMILSKWILSTPLILITMMDMMVYSVKKWKTALKKPRKFQRKLWIRLPNELENLESGDKLKCLS